MGVGIRVDLIPVSHRVYCGHTRRRGVTPSIPVVLLVSPATVPRRVNADTDATSAQQLFYRHGAGQEQSDFGYDQSFQGYRYCAAHHQLVEQTADDGHANRRESHHQTHFVFFVLAAEFFLTTCKRFSELYYTV